MNIFKAEVDLYNCIMSWFIFIICVINISMISVFVELFSEDKDIWLDLILLFLYTVVNIKICNTISALANTISVILYSKTRKAMAYITSIEELR